MSGAELACMNSIDIALDDDTHLLLVNRVFAPHDSSKDVTFATRWIRHVGTKFHPNVKGCCRKSPHVGAQCRKWFSIGQEQRKYLHDGINTHV